MKGLNIKGLCKQIKASKNVLLWSFNDKKHFITNRQWAVTFDDLPVDVLIALFQVFDGKKPQEGKSLSNHYGVTLTPDAPKPIVMNGGVSYEWTGYYKDYDNGLMRIFKNEEDVSFVNRDNIIAVEYGTQVIGYGKNRPIEFPDINYLVMPIRVEDHEGLLSIMKAMGD